jgi:hypothetical protein
MASPLKRNVFVSLVVEKVIELITGWLFPVEFESWAAKLLK